MKWIPFSRRTKEATIRTTASNNKTMEDNNTIRLLLSENVTHVGNKHRIAGKDYIASKYENGCWYLTRESEKVYYSEIKRIKDGRKRD